MQGSTLSYLLAESSSLEHPCRVGMPRRLQQRSGAYPHAARLSAVWPLQVGRANYTTSDRLLRTGALTAETLAMLQSYFRPHNDALHAMFPHSRWW